MLTDPKVLREIQHRDDLPDFLNRHGLTGQAAELGTYLGEFAATIMNAWAGRQLNLIDPYRHFDFDEYLDGSAVDHQTGQPVDFDSIAWQASLRLNPYPASHFIRKTSAEAVAKFSDASLDFVYIDANHSYLHATEDLSLWWPKVIPGGIVGLHDCYTRDDGQLRCGVFDAVMDWSDRIKQRPHLTRCTTAWFLKV